mmetsp:Transcript_35551/g.53472  ORF Transcript_35551/g.53472 Transcript_35551/m.53472 type:complete len:377 (-) Transcript_35551:1-1131(-)
MTVRQKRIYKRGKKETYALLCSAATSQCSSKEDHHLSPLRSCCDLHFSISRDEVCLAGGLAGGAIIRGLLVALHKLGSSASAIAAERPIIGFPANVGQFDHPDSLQVEGCTHRDGAEGSSKHVEDARTKPRGLCCLQSDDWSGTTKDGEGHVEGDRHASVADLCWEELHVEVVCEGADAGLQETEAQAVTQDHKAKVQGVGSDEDPKGDADKCRQHNAQTQNEEETQFVRSPPEHHSRENCEPPRNEICDHSIASREPCCAQKGLDPDANSVAEHSVRTGDANAEEDIDPVLAEDLLQLRQGRNFDALRVPGLFILKHTGLWQGTPPNDCDDPGNDSEEEGQAPPPRSHIVFAHDAFQDEDHELRTEEAQCTSNVD